MHTWKDMNTERLIHIAPAICLIDSHEKYEAIDQVIAGCSIFSDLPDIHAFREAVRKRERIETTGIGHGVAVAHGKVAQLSRIKVGLGISPNGIEYASKDGTPVHLLFVIASSPTRQFEYLRTLSAILRSVRSSGLRNELLQLEHAITTGYCVPDTASSRCTSFLEMMARQHFSWLFPNEQVDYEQR